MPETKSTEKFDIQDETKITITLPSTAYFVSGIRDFTLNLIKNTSDFPEKWAFRFQSVIDELCNNAIEYGSSAGSEIRVVFFIKKGDFIQVSVEDTGTGKEKMKAKTLEDLFSERRAQDYVFTGIRGRGLAKIVGEWTDEVKFEDRTDGGIKITVKKYLKDSRLETKTQQAGINNQNKKQKHYNYNNPIYIMTSATINIEDINANLKVVHIAGQLDESNVDEKIKEIYGVVEKNSDNLSLIFDLENLEYMNSKSIGYLTDLYGKLSESGGKVVIAAAKPNIVDILQVVGLTQLIQSYNSVKEAASALGADSPAAPAPAAAPETPAATETAAPAVETPAAEAPQEPQAPQTPAQNENPDQQNNETFKIQ